MAITVDVLQRITSVAQLLPDCVEDLLPAIVHVNDVPASFPSHLARTNVEGRHPQIRPFTYWRAGIADHTSTVHHQAYKGFDREVLIKAHRVMTIMFAELPHAPSHIFRASIDVGPQH